MIWIVRTFLPLSFHTSPSLHYLTYKPLDITLSVIQSWAKFALQSFVPLLTPLFTKFYRHVPSWQTPIHGSISSDPNFSEPFQCDACTSLLTLTDGLYSLYGGKTNTTTFLKLCRYLIYNIGSTPD